MNNAVKEWITWRTLTGLILWVCILALVLVLPPITLAADSYLPPHGSLETWDQVAYVLNKLASAYLGAAEFNGGECIGETRPMPFCSTDALLRGPQRCATYFTVYLCLRQFLWAIANAGLVSCDRPLNLPWPLFGTPDGLIDCAGLQADVGVFTGR